MRTWPRASVEPSCAGSIGPRTVTTRRSSLTAAYSTAMPTLVRAARVADAEVAGWLEDAVVRVEGGLVDAVLAARDLPSDAATTHDLHDLGDVSLLPGFVE